MRREQRCYIEVVSEEERGYMEAVSEEQDAYKRGEISEYHVYSTYYTIPIQPTYNVAI